MRNLVRLASVLCAVALVAACATGPKSAEMKGGIPGLDPAKGRIFFYRNSSMLIGGGLQPTILLNGTKVGDSIPGGFYFVDRSPSPMVSVA